MRVRIGEPLFSLAVFSWCSRISRVSVIRFCINSIVLLSDSRTFSAVRKRSQTRNHGRLRARALLSMSSSEQSGSRHRFWLVGWLVGLNFNSQTQTLTKDIKN